MKRLSAKKVAAAVTAPSGNTPMINRHLNELDAEVAVWAGIANDESNFYEPLTLRGVYRSPSIQILETDKLKYIEVRLDLEGV